ncbi:putative uncharacterized protein C8orf44 [Plecturocebus cupreus]
MHHEQLIEVLQAVQEMWHQRLPSGEGFKELPFMAEGKEELVHGYHMTEEEERERERRRCQALVNNQLTVERIAPKLSEMNWVRAWWLMPVIPVLWEAKAGGSPEVRSPRPAWVTQQNPAFTKNTKFSLFHLIIVPTHPARTGKPPDFRNLQAETDASLQCMATSAPLPLEKGVIRTESRSVAQAGCNGMISDHCNLGLLGSCDPPASASQMDVENHRGQDAEVKEVLRRHQARSKKVSNPRVSPLEKEPFEARVACERDSRTARPDRAAATKELMPPPTKCPESKASIRLRGPTDYGTEECTRGNTGGRPAGRLHIRAALQG